MHSISVPQIGQAYWSDELGEAQTYGDITVTLKRKELIIGLVVREFCVQSGSKVLFSWILAQPTGTALSSLFRHRRY